MLSPGAGAGARASAMNDVKQAAERILKASLAYEMGSKEQQALLRAVAALHTVTQGMPAGPAAGGPMIPPEIAAAAMKRPGAGPMAPPPGIAGAPPPPDVVAGAPPPGAM